VLVGLVLVSPFLGPAQPQLIGCQTGRENMEVVDAYAERKTFGEATAPSYGFRIGGVLWCGVYFDRPFTQRAYTD
jgi:hypothetical protein